MSISEVALVAIILHWGGNGIRIPKHDGDSTLSQTAKLAVKARYLLKGALYAFTLGLSQNRSHFVVTHACHISSPDVWNSGCMGDSTTCTFLGQDP